MRIVTFLPIPGALLSIVGSALILDMICREKKQTPYRRLLFAMSMCDILSSATFVLFPILVPTETSHWIYAIGNETTCNLLGTMLQISFSNFWYAGMLSVYFVISIALEWRSRTIAVYVEPLMHLLALGCMCTRRW